jgi:cytochrome P450
MDMIINETLRLYPPAFRVDRVCNEDYSYKEIQIKKGQVWTASIYALHHDPDIYPDPYTFDPERFNEENKKNRDNEAFIPFGAGPRNCIAMRFALIEIKLLLATVLSKFQFEKCDQTAVTFFNYEKSLNLIKCLQIKFKFLKDKIVLDTSGQTKPNKPIIVKVARR